MSHTAKTDSKKTDKYEMIFASIYEIRREEEAPDFLVTWDKKALQDRNEVREALLDGIRTHVGRVTSSQCQILHFTKDASGTKAESSFSDVIKTGRHRLAKFH